MFSAEHVHTCAQQQMEFLRMKHRHLVKNVESLYYILVISNCFRIEIYILYADK